MVVINQMQPISVGVALPEQQLNDVRRYREAGTLRVTAIEPTSHRPLATGDLMFMHYSRSSRLFA
jgi:hypothetical protein